MMEEIVHMMVKKNCKDLIFLVSGEESIHSEAQSNVVDDSDDDVHS